MVNFELFKLVILQQGLEKNTWKIERRLVIVQLYEEEVCMTCTLVHS